MMVKFNALQEFAWARAPKLWFGDASNFDFSTLMFSAGKQGAKGTSQYSFLEHQEEEKSHKILENFG